MNVLIRWPRGSIPARPLSGKCPTAACRSRLSDVASAPRSPHANLACDGHRESACNRSHRRSPARVTRHRGRANRGKDKLVGQARRCRASVVMWSGCGITRCAVCTQRACTQANDPTRHQRLGRENRAGVWRVARRRRGLPRAVPRSTRPALGTRGARQARGDGRERCGDSRRRREGGHGVSNDPAAAALARRSLRLSLRFIDAFMAGFLASSADRDSLFAGWQREVRFGSRIDERRDLSCGRARASCTRLLRRSRDVPNGHSRAFLRGDASGFPPRSSEVSRCTHVHNP